MGFRIAFGVREYKTGIALDDPNFVQWEVYLTTSFDSVTIERKPLGIHRCTEHDYAELWPAKKSQVEVVEKEKQRKQLYCINSNETINIFG